MRERGVGSLLHDSFELARGALELGVELLLQRQDVAECVVLDPDGGGGVMVRDLVAAVNASREGCT